MNTPRERSYTPLEHSKHTIDSLPDTNFQLKTPIEVDCFYEDGWYRARAYSIGLNEGGNGRTKQEALDNLTEYIQSQYRQFTNPHLKFPGTKAIADKLKSVITKVNAPETEEAVDVNNQA